MTDELERQEEIHEALQKILGGDVLTSWALVYEAVDTESVYFGQISGPEGILPWRTRGLLSQAMAYLNAETVAGEIDDFEPEESDE